MGKKLPDPPVPCHHYGVSACVWNGRFVLFGVLRRGVPGRAVRPFGMVFDPETRAWERRPNAHSTSGSTRPPPSRATDCSSGPAPCTAPLGNQRTPRRTTSGRGNGRNFPEAPIPPRSLASARAHGSRVTVWVGWTSERDRMSSLRDGARYDFDTGAWEKIAPLPPGVPYELHPGW